MTTIIAVDKQRKLAADSTNAAVFIGFLFIAAITALMAALYSTNFAPREDAERRAQERNEISLVTQKLASQSVCVKLQAKSFIKARNQPVTGPALADFVRGCKETAVTDPTVKSQLDILNATE